MNDETKQNIEVEVLKKLPCDAFLAKRRCADGYEVSQVVESFHSRICSAPSLEEALARFAKTFVETITLEVTDATKPGRVLGKIEMPMEQYRKYYAITDVNFLTPEQRKGLDLKGVVLIALSAPEDRYSWWTRMWKWLNVMGMIFMGMMGLVGLMGLMIAGCATKGGWPCWAWQKNTDQQNERAGAEYLKTNELEVAPQFQVITNEHPPGLLHHANWFTYTTNQLNVTPAPENPSVVMLGGPDLSHDLVTTNASGQIIRVHDGWVYRFYPNGGIDSITQLATDPITRSEQIH